VARHRVVFLDIECDEMMGRVGIPLGSKWSIFRNVKSRTGGSVDQNGYLDNGLFQVKSDERFGRVGSIFRKRGEH